MTYLALALAAALVAVIFALLGVIRSQQRAHARREDLLLNQLLHAVGKAWQPSPAAEARRSHDAESQPLAWTPTPEQTTVF